MDEYFAIKRPEPEQGKGDCIFFAILLGGTLVITFLVASYLLSYICQIIGR